MLSHRVLIFLPILVSCYFAVVTCEVTLAELEYIADHLEPEECSKLVFALQTEDWQEVWKAPNQTDLEPCLEKLVTWNSAGPAGETQAQLSNRLLQMGRGDLGNWLSKTVFQEIGFYINESILKNPFKETSLRTNTIQHGDNDSNFTDVHFQAHDHLWRPIDTILLVLISCVSVALIWTGYRLLQLLFPMCFKIGEYSPISNN